MNTPLTHVGQTAHPEVPAEVQQHCSQVKSQHQAAAGSNQIRSDAGNAQQSSTRLPQLHQQQGDSSLRADGQQRAGQHGETRAEDTALPAPTDAD